MPSPPRDHLWSPERRARLVRLCTAVVGDAAVAEDLAQEALLEAWRHQDRLVDPAGADAWLGAIARNVCRRWQRTRAGLPVPTAATDRADRPDGLDGLDGVLEREELVELLERALGLLTPQTRAVLVGHYVEGRSHAELAARLGTSADAVSMRVSRGRVRLRHLLETTFADDAVAEGWTRRADAGWRRTRLVCPACGLASVDLRHDADEVAFRCRSCGPHVLLTRLPLDVPAFAALVGTVRRPSALQHRLAAWTHTYFDAERPACVRCTRPVVVRRYARDDEDSWASRHGWYADCVACGEVVSTSVAGRTLALPHVRAARRRDPRLRLLTPHEVVHGGAAATVVGLGRVDGRPEVTATYLSDSLRLVDQA